MRLLSIFVWLIFVGGSLVYLVDRFRDGDVLSSDLTALLPTRDGDGIRAAASQAAASALSRDAVFLFGHPERAIAEETAAHFARDLAGSGLVADVGGQGSETSYHDLGALLFTHRAGLLSEADRQTLLTGQASELYRRALAQIFSPIGSVDSRLLAADPFQLFPHYVGAISVLGDDLSAGPRGSAAEANGKVYALVSATFEDEPYALSFQRRFMAWFDDWQASRAAQPPADATPVEVLRTGAIFYAHAGAKQGLDEATVIGGVTLVGVIVLVLLAFGSLQPIALSMLSIASGLVVALSINLLLFDSLHFVAVMFGAGLIGISVDYSFHYCCERFDQEATPAHRLRGVLPGATLGLVTSSIGFLTLAWAPFPGLRQIALFSTIGLAMAYFTVVIWFPVLDRSRGRDANAWMMRVATLPRRLWYASGMRLYRRSLLALFACLVVLGGSAVTFSDDIRRFQALSADLTAQESVIKRIAGFETGIQFFVVTGATDEEILQREEALRGHLAALQSDGVIASILAVSEIVPSAARQGENIDLVSRHLGAAARERLKADTGLSFDTEARPANASSLTLDIFRANAPRTLTDLLLPDLGDRRRASIVVLRGVIDGGRVQAAATDLAGVDYVDPTSDVSALFGTYRKAAILLLGVSVLVMVPVLIWRYGVGGSVRLLAPPLSAVLIAPCVVALAGEPLTFFNAMGLILVFAIGIDYALFCREAASARRDVNSLANGLAAASTILSFGLLAFSGIPVVHSFGLTIFVGILIAFIMAPLAERTSGREEAFGGSA